MVDTLLKTDRTEVPERPEERQRFTRQAVILAAKLRDSQGSVPCDVLDLSAGGAKVQASVTFPIGAEVQLEIGDLQSFHATVAWCQGALVGLTFHDSPDDVATSMPALLEAARDERERRRHIRSSVLWTGEIYGGLRRAKCELLNISSGGAKLRTEGNFPVGTEVAVRSIRFGEFTAEVIWQDKASNTIGVSFPLNGETARQLQKCMPSGRKRTP